MGEQIGKVLTSIPSLLPQTRQPNLASDLGLGKLQSEKKEQGTLGRHQHLQHLLTRPTLRKQSLQQIQQLLINLAPKTVEPLFVTCQVLCRSKPC